MKNKYKLLTKGFLAFLGSLLILSCGEKETEPALDTDLLRGKQWQLTKVLFNEKGFFEEDPVPACQQDDIIEFQADQIFVRENGQNQCFTQEPSSVVSQWSIYQEPKTIVFDHIEYQILSLTRVTLELQRELYGNDGQVTIQYYYTAK
jgi:hypothetical protein